MRIRRASPEAKAREAQRTRERRQDPEKAAQDRATSLAWKKRNPERARAHYATPAKVLYNIAWNKAHPDRRLAAAKRYQARNPEIGKVAQQRRRARLAAVESTLTQAEWLQIVADFNGRCAYCLRDDLPLQQEHMDPLSKRGAHAVGNVVPSCGPCNYRKHTKNLLQFLGTE